MFVPRSGVWLPPGGTSPLYPLPLELFTKRTRDQRPPTEVAWRSLLSAVRSFAARADPRGASKLFMLRFNLLSSSKWPGVTQVAAPHQVTPWTRASQLPGPKRGNCEAEIRP